jgi:hypothetical protein
MEPFKIPESLKSLTDPYPHPKGLLEIAQIGGDQARIAIAQLWLSEGIPHSFGCCPAIYEAVRCWLSVKLEVHAKEISLIGSARLGKSLASKKLGKPFLNYESDLDLFIVSRNLFEKLKEDSYRWSSDFEDKRIKPRNKREEHYWQNNNKQLPEIIARGFIFSDRIPNFPEYPIAQNVNNTMWLLVEKLKITPNAPKPKKASIRCYSSWDSFVRQQLLNLAPRPDKDSQHTKRF